MAKGMEPHEFVSVKHPQHIPLVQRATLLGCEEIAVGARHVWSKSLCQNLGNIHDSDSVRRFWLLFLSPPDTPTYVEHSAIRAEVGRSQCNGLSDYSKPARTDLCGGRGVNSRALPRLWQRKVDDHFPNADFALFAGTGLRNFWLGSHIAPTPGFVQNASCFQFNDFLGVSR